MPFRILALSGGGYRGLYTAHILTEYEKRSGKPIAQCFDLIAGTSIGGILALGLALEIPAEVIQDKFIEKGTSIFSARPKPKGLLNNICDVARFVLKPKYDGKELRKTIEEILGVDAILGKAKHRVIIPAINMTTGAIQIFKTPHHKTFVRDHELKVVDIGMATSAAPTVFPMARVGTSHFVDGGLFANAPDFCALHESNHFLGVKSSDVQILSIGTTTTRYSLANSSGANFGAFDWLVGGRLLSTMISAQQQLTEFTLEHLLGDRFVRVDQHQSHEQAEELGLDVATKNAQETIIGLADATVQRSIVDQRIIDMLDGTAEPAIFFHGPNKSNH
jgi:uncharacterized protein